MKAKLKLEGREIEISEITKAEGLKKFTGLMFKSQSKAKALLFEFRKPTKNSIHSLFCPDFLLISLDDNNKILEHKFVFSNKFRIKLEKEYYKLLEIPLNEKYAQVTKFFLDKTQK